MMLVWSLLLTAISLTYRLQHAVSWWWFWAVPPPEGMTDSNGHFAVNWKQIQRLLMFGEIWEVLCPKTDSSVLTCETEGGSWTNWKKRTWA